MLDSLTNRLEGGATMQSRTVSGQIGEGQIAEKLGQLQQRYPAVGIGSYPYYRGRIFGTSLVMRGIDPAELDRVAAEATALIREFGVEPVIGEPA
jgi:molybdopterin-biosynthesis enzyme MoeA-like protein